MIHPCHVCHQLTMITCSICGADVCPDHYNFRDGLTLCLDCYECEYCEAPLCNDCSGECCEGEDEEVDEEEEIEDEYTPVPMCESCHQNRGQDNSAFIFDEGEEVGIWICPPCEEEAAHAHDEWISDIVLVAVKGTEEVRWVRWQLKPHTYASLTRGFTKYVGAANYKAHWDLFSEWIRTRELEIASITLWGIPYEDRRNQP